MLPLTLGFVFWSVLATLDFTKYSLTLFALSCQWPWELFLFMGAVLAAISLTTGLHIYSAWVDGIFYSRIAEIVSTLLAFLLVNIGDSNLHLHHWFLGWLIGQHANQKYWWSTVSSAVMWGCYINGIASWGRDPMLGCKAAFWAATNNYCPFVGERAGLDRERAWKIDVPFSDPLCGFSLFPFLPSFLPSFFSLLLLLLLSSSRMLLRGRLHRSSNSRRLHAGSSRALTFALRRAGLAELQRRRKLRAVAHESR